MKTVVVIGGGITGLSTMYYLQKYTGTTNKKIQLILIEANEHLGGKIRTIRSGEFILESGADSIVARKEGVTSLLKELKLHDEIVNNATGRSFIYHHNCLTAIPEETIFGIPMSPEALFGSELISSKGKMTALKDFFTTNTEFTKDSSVGLFLEEFLGKEIVENQIAPVLSGVYSGRLNELTLATTLPYLLDYKNQYGSIMKGLAENKEKFQSGNKKKFISFQNGLSTIIDRLEEHLSDIQILKNTKATKIKQTKQNYTIELANGESIETDYIVLSTPHNVAQSLLQNKKLDTHFNQLFNSSLISIYLGFDLPDSQLPADGTGFIVPEHSDLICNACTWTSRKWTHTSKQNHLLLRLFYKKTNEETFNYLNRLTKEELVEIALKDIEKSLNIKGKPITVEVTKWQDQMPKYHLQHRKIIQSLTEDLSVLYPNILLAGCSYFGVGIGDCIENGRKTAQQLIHQLTK
ncbi:oxygen-dependent protoporphyrinogen oxidase [Oikeobacillus pervagus]|uniref:Coproporphyrinogen III oxidase n=1 Tax=Oikeobacillus pervagus TaxID=1325931 RepID=A0AAJ1T1S9_9BACI|nr:protoporphyrinogen oxidase [Oikeobacillus pervagus]MDQ0214374.1 oxygen-dependent protoporphyrinogen oxidase [Oikeobacillus pervagus]